MGILLALSAIIFLIGFILLGLFDLKNLGLFFIFAGGFMFVIFLIIFISVPYFITNEIQEALYRIDVNIK